MTFYLIALLMLNFLVNAWLWKEWKDYKLDWNETEYGGVKSIRLPSKMIWTPDILMYNRWATGVQGVTWEGRVSYRGAKCHPGGEG